MTKKLPRPQTPKQREQRDQQRHAELDRVLKRIADTQAQGFRVKRQLRAARDSRAHDR